jgi:hypothetical protein
MSLRPDERRWRAQISEILLAVYDELRTFVRLVSPIQPNEHPTIPTRPAADDQREPRSQATLNIYTKRTNAEMHEIEEERRSNQSFRDRSLTVQWCLFTATMLAFGAAIWYASIASGQKVTMDRTLNEIVRQTGFADKASKGATDSAKSAQDAIMLARDNFTQDQRPYIWNTNNGLGGPEFVLSPNTIPPTGQIVWNFHYTNYGRSPAYNLIAHSLMRVGIAQPFRESYGSQGVHFIGIPMPPNSEQFGTAVSFPSTTRDEYDRLLRIDNAIAIRVHMEYSDAYGGRYETGICAGRLASSAIKYCEGSYIK